MAVFFPLPADFLGPDADIETKIVITVAYAVGLLCGVLGRILEELGFPPEYGSDALFNAGVFFVTDNYSDIKDLLAPVRVLVKVLLEYLFGSNTPPTPPTPTEPTEPKDLIAEDLFDITIFDTTLLSYPMLVEGLLFILICFIITVISLNLDEENSDGALSFLS